MKTIAAVGVVYQVHCTHNHSCYSIILNDVANLNYHAFHAFRQADFHNDNHNICQPISWLMTTPDLNQQCCRDQETKFAASK